MIVHLKHHKEGRNFKVRPVTGNYTNCHIYIKTNEFRYSPHSEGEFKRYDFGFKYGRTEDALNLVKEVNEKCGDIILKYDEDNHLVRAYDYTFPEITDEMPSESRLPKVYETNPTRLVEILIY